MITSRRFAMIALLAVVGSSGVLVAIAQQPGLSAPAVGAAHPEKAFNGSSIITLDARVSADFAISILPVTLLANGQSVRPLHARALYEAKGGRFLGEGAVHKLIPSESSEVIDLSSAELDVNLHDQTLPSSYRKFTVRVTPGPGKTWADVRDFKDDLVIVSSAP